MLFFNSNSLGNAKNIFYPNEFNVNQRTSIEQLKTIFTKDYACAKYKSFKRSEINFVSSDVLALDCDNDHSDKPDSWISPQDVINEFDDVFMVFHMSRNHMKEKDGKSARPRFHAFMWMKEIKDPIAYKEMKRRINSVFPFFDKNAEDAARFFFGTSEVDVLISPGHKTIDEWLDNYDAFANMGEQNEIIPAGQRNSSMSKFAAITLKRYGDTQEAEEIFYQKNDDCCSPPLDEEEMKSIWKSALRFYKDKILNNPNYISPEEYNNTDSYVPSDLSDVGQAKNFVEHYGSIIAYNPSMKFVVYKDNRWIESEELALELLHRYTDKQILHAYKQMKAANDSGDEIKIKKAKEFLKFAVSRRNSNFINATLKQATPYILIGTERFDADPFMLSTPSGVYDLRKGPHVLPKEHCYSDYITKMTACNPSLKGKELWAETLNKIFSSNNELIKYVQQCCGLAAVGAVFNEIMIIAHGEGGNGKSTFWNTVLKVFGDYGGTLNSDNLFVNNGKSSRFEKAFLKGKRLIISSENEQGARLNDGMVKQLCSTDKIKGEKKFKDEFDFIPSHTLILYTNHLPKVTAGDDGIWRRLKVVPFTNKFSGDNDTKNFAEILFDECREYILYWVMEGAKIVIDNKFHIDEPDVVLAACKRYKNDNDWLQQFINECCKKVEGEKVGSSELYEAYRKYAWHRNEYVRPSSDFRRAMEDAGYKTTHPHNKVYYHDIRLMNDFELEGDILD